MTMRHALSVDVEDWFQVLNMAHVIDRARWEDFELRCGDSTRRLLDLFAKRSARATFYFLGWIAERLPDLVQEVRAAGHEIGSHGYDHRLLDDLGRDGFRLDLARTADVLRGITGESVRTFRACTWSVTARTPWAVDELLAQGIAIDSSIFPIGHPDYGVPGAPTSPYRLRGSGDGVDGGVGGDGNGSARPAGELVEFPPLCLDLLGRRLPVGGGGYLRLFPLALLRRGLRQQEQRGMPGCVYLHPWEVDPAQPRQRLGGLRGFRHYVNLRRTLPKLDRLLREFRFDTVSAVVDQFGTGWTARLPAHGVGELLQR